MILQRMACCGLNEPRPGVSGALPSGGSGTRIVQDDVSDSGLHSLAMRSLTAAWSFVPPACSSLVWIVTAACLPAPGPTMLTPRDPEPTFTFEELAPGVLAAVVARDPPHYAFSNSLVVDLGGELLVLDTQQSPAAAGALIAEIRARWAEPVRWVVNTHWHADHVYGNIAYRRAWPGVVILAHRATREDLLTLGETQLEQDRMELPASIAARRQWLTTGRGPDSTPLTPAQRTRVERSLELRMGQLEQLRTLELVTPDSVFDEALSLAGSERELRLIHLGPAHTRGDVAVWLPRERILAAGDLVEDAYPWVQNANIAGWVRALERIERLGPVIVLPAHGSPWRNPGARLAVQRAVFHAAVAAACDSGDPAPAALADFRAVHNLPEGPLEIRFWGALVAAARAATDLPGSRC